MIATCKFCQVLITPIEVLPLKPAALARIPPEQLELMKFSAAVTEHVRHNHPEFLQYVQQLAGNFIGHCTLSVVAPVGLNHRQFMVMCDSDNAQLRAAWEAMPNPPDPDTTAQLMDEARANMVLAKQQDDAEAGGITPSPAAGDCPVPIPPPPGKIRLT